MPRQQKVGKSVSRICPWWLGYFLANPLRKLAHDPEKILGHYLAEGMTAVDIGSGMGYFSIPMATLVGGKGKVICVDLQEKMLSSLRKRARKAGVVEQIETKRAESHSLDLKDKAGTADFVLLFAVAHEIPDLERAFREICDVLKSGGRLLISEPKGHVTGQQFAKTISIAQASGFKIVATPKIRGEHSTLLEKTL
jgi:ubiquinone/menaquinone biosynthesis C-methylase UbiE